MSIYGTLSIPMSELELQLLGFPQATFDGQPLKLKWRQALALLAYLTFQEAPVSRDASGSSSIVVLVAIRRLETCTWMLTTRHLMTQIL